MYEEERKEIFITLPVLITIILLLSIAAGTIFFSRDLPFIYEDAPGPRFFPIVSAILLIILTFLYLLETVIKKDRNVKFPKLSKMSRPGIFFAISFMIPVFWNVLGAFITVFFVCFIELLILEKFSYLRSFLISFFFTFFSWIMFQYVLGIRLPLGLIKNFI